MLQKLSIRVFVFLMVSQAGKTLLTFQGFTQRNVGLVFYFKRSEARGSVDTFVLVKVLCFFISMGHRPCCPQGPCGMIDSSSLARLSRLVQDSLAQSLVCNR